MSLQSRIEPYDTSTMGQIDPLCQEEQQITETYRYQAVQQAIGEMRERFMEPLTLNELSNITHLSPFYFNRVFRSITGISPSVFLAAIRLERAKKLLLHTNRSVTEICFDVGYNSMGTFTYRFNLFVGIPPSRFRLFAQENLMQFKPQSLIDSLKKLTAGFEGEPCIQGSITAPGPFHGLIFVGIFRDPLPQGQPVSCTVLTAPGSFRLPAIMPDGKYYLFAAAMDYTQNLFDMLNSNITLHGGSGKHPLTIRAGRATGRTDMQLRAAGWNDPPQLIALPCLLLSRFAEVGMAIK